MQNMAFIRIHKNFIFTKLTTTGEANIKTSLHLFDHLLKPIVLYGSEILGTFRTFFTSSAACKKTRNLFYI